MSTRANDVIDFDFFSRLDLRVGIITHAVVSPKARIPAFILNIDFGPLGFRQSSARITQRYTPETLTGQWVVAIVNFPDKHVAGVVSECLVLGVIGEAGDVVLLKPEPGSSPGDPVR